MQPVPVAWKWMLPWSLIWFRGVVAPALAWLAALHGQHLILAGLMVIAFLSDWLDGVLARCWGTVTARLRRADTLADTVFYLHVLAIAVTGHWEQIAPLLPLLGGLLGLELLCQIISYTRWGCRTATHSYLCKTWGVFLCLATTELFVWHAVRESMWICLIVGYFAYLDVIAILCLMPVAAVDVPSALHAWQRRTRPVPGPIPNAGETA